MDTMSSLIDTRLVKWYDHTSQKNRRIYLRVSDSFSNIRKPIVDIRKHHFPRGWEDKFDLHSYHIMAYEDELAVACLRLTSAQDHEIPNLRFYSKPALLHAETYYSSMSRFYMLPTVRMPLRVMVCMLQRAGELALELGSILDVSNCATRAAKYYERRGCIVDSSQPFAHPTDDTTNFPAYLPACPINRSFISPILSPAHKQYASDTLCKILGQDQNQDKLQPTPNQVSPWFVNNLVAASTRNQFTTCSVVPSGAFAVPENSPA